MRSLALAPQRLWSETSLARSKPVRAAPSVRAGSVRRIQSALRRPPPWVVLGTCWLLLVLVALADGLAGLDVHLEAFYLAPIAAAAWTGGRRAGLATAALATVLWTQADITARTVPIRYGLIAWNAAVELAFFSGVSLLVSFVEAQAEHLRGLAREDPLTGVANRRAFLDALGGAVDLSMRRAGAWTVVYIDLDDFKLINDRLGHTAGDEVLRRVADTLRTSTRSLDVVARLGGDEFAVLLPETDGEQAKMAVRKLQGLLDAAMTKGGWSVTFSIGVTTFLSVPPSPDAVLAAADAQMYEVKRGRKDGASFGVWEGGQAGPESRPALGGAPTAPTE